MRQEYLDVLSKGYSIEICVDYDASGRSVDEDEISPDSVTYYIRDGELHTWDDDEEFDIKKVQLIKEDYTCAEFPYFILCEKILYDGKDVLSNDEFNAWTEYCPEEKMYNTAIIDELYIKG